MDERNGTALFLLGIWYLRYLGGLYVEWKWMYAHSIESYRKAQKDRRMFEN